MPQMADESAVGLAQRDAAAGALVVVGLGHIQGDGAALVARQHLWATRPVGQELKHRTGLPGTGSSPNRARV